MIDLRSRPARTTLLILLYLGTEMLAAGAQDAPRGVPPAVRADELGSTLRAAADLAVVTTDRGRVQGFVRDQVFTFKGLPYARAERFEPPRAVDAWTDTRRALSWGNTCPQQRPPQLPEPQTFFSDWRFWPASEDCLNLNVWTPGLDAKPRRPVMVWLHGGGYATGSSMELPVYDGTRLAAAGDVVVVSVNHRLNVLGYLDLSAYGRDFRHSGNAGMLDIVAALEWVKRNIARFGGDPGNVTIFGQSGGGAKVATLMTAPAAKGLFHKAIMQSGAPGGIVRPAMDGTVARRVAELTLEFAGVAAVDVKALQEVSYEALVAAADRARARASDELGLVNTPFGPAIGWSPVVDGDFLPQEPFADAAPAVSKGIPLLLGSTLAEFENINPRLAGKWAWTDEQALRFLEETQGERAAELFAAYRDAYPALPPGDRMAVDTRFRAGVLHTAKLKAAQGDPVYAYLFAWRSPVLDYGWAAGHTAEVGFVFDNPEDSAQSSGGGPEVAKLARTMSRAWLNFARHGDPNHDGLPAWPVWTPQQPATMIFDQQADVRVGHDSRLMTLLGVTP